MKGISLIALIITIIVIIILAFIIVGVAKNTPETANMAVFVDTLSKVQYAVVTKLAENNFEYLDSDIVDLNTGFKRVYVLNKPDEFISFPANEGEEGKVIGYVIDLSKIELSQSIYGQGYKANLDEVEFELSDVFIYDAESHVFYTKGYRDKDIYYFTDKVTRNVENLSNDPVDPSEEPVDPSEEPVDPSEDPVDPSEDPVDPSEDPVGPSEDPPGPSDPPEEPEIPPEDPPEEPEEIKGVNAPVLGSGMFAVYWDVSGNEVTSNDTGYVENDWYDYEIQTGDTINGGTSKWANAKISDGSYFVWIPRYAYKIIYYTTASKTTVSGTKTNYGDIDVLFLSGTTNDYIDGTTGEVLPLPSGYTVHPAFTSNMSLGGWRNELQGLWVAKYETSQNDATSSSVGSSGVPQSKPGVKSWTNISLGNCFTEGKSYRPEHNSHILKNSEWGAVAYLTHSKFGRNATEVTINSNSSKVTGYGLTTNQYNTSIGKLASSTGNIYGIYDLSGGASEFAAAYYKDFKDGFIFKFSPNTAPLIYIDGVSGTKRTESTEYVTLYGSTEIIGDAATAVSNWNGDLYSFIGQSRAGMVRGGNYSDGTGAGIFLLYYHMTGLPGANDGFRMCLAI